MAALGVWPVAQAIAQVPVVEPAKPPERPALSPTDPEPAKGGVREAKPETFYLIDKDGKLVPFFDIPFEEFRRLYLLDRKLKAPDVPPRYSLQQMTATGTVEGATATLDVNFRVQLNESGWTRVPLRMNNGVLVREESSKEDQAKQFIEYDKGADGYVAWLQGEKGTSQTVRLKFLLTLEHIAGESRLALQVPRASGAELRLKVPTANAVVEGIEGVIVQPGRKLPDGRTELHLLGLSGDVPLAWREAREQSAKTAAVLEASSATLFRFVGQSHVSSEVRLKVRCLNGPLDSFQVRLPAGLALIPVSQPRYSATVVEPKNSAKKGASANGQLVEVKLSAKTSEAVEVTLLAEMPREPASAVALWDTSGFEVLGAIGQWGHIDLAVEGDWSLNWVEGSHVQRVTEGTDAAARQAVARFEFSRQPYSLKVQVLPKRTRISVEPTYVVQIEPQQARLEARLKYKVRGARAYSVDVDLSGWKLDPGGITPANLVQLDALSHEEVSPLKIPLAPIAQAAGGEFELRLVAYREIKPGEKFSFTLPRPVAGALTPAAVVVLPADNVELTPLAAELQGLSAETLPPLVSLPPRQLPPLSYRDRSETTPAQFVGQYKLRKGTVSVGGTGRVQLDERAAHVEQRLQYRISYEPLTELVVDAPRDLFEAGAIKFTLEGEVLEAVRLEDEPSDLGAESRQLVRLDLGEERIGQCEITATYVVRLPQLEAGKTAEVNVPLVVPTDGDDVTLTTNSLNVGASSTIDYERLGGDWTAYEDSSTLADEQKLFAPAATADLVLRVSLLQTQKRGATAVRQAWVQSWFTTGERRDRAVFRLTTSDGRARIQLPAGARMTDLDLAVNGRRLPIPRSSAPGQLDLELAGGPGQESVVELWYSFDEGRPAGGGFVVEPPQIVGAARTSRFYWQLVVPRREHLIFSPAGMTPELAWRREAFGWVRQSLLDQGELEKWIGASPQAPMPSAVNQYLFSSFGQVERIEARTAGRAWILLAASGAVLLVGLPLVYFPVLRHPAVLLLIAVGALAAGLFDPEIAMQAAQLAVVGVALVLASRVLRWMLTRRRDRRAIIHGSSLLGLDAGTSDSRPLRREVDSRVSTATAPLTIPRPAAELRP